MITFDFGEEIYPQIDVVKNELKSLKWHNLFFEEGDAGDNGAGNGGGGNNGSDGGGDTGDGGDSGAGNDGGGNEGTRGGGYGPGGTHGGNDPAGQGNAGSSSGNEGSSDPIGDIIGAAPEQKAGFVAAGLSEDGRNFAASKAAFDQKDYAAAYGYSVAGFTGMVAPDFTKGATAFSRDPSVENAYNTAKGLATDVGNVATGGLLGIGVDFAEDIADPEVSPQTAFKNAAIDLGITALSKTVAPAISTAHAIDAFGKFGNVAAAQAVAVADKAAIGYGLGKLGDTMKGADMSAPSTASSGVDAFGGQGVGGNEPMIGNLDTMKASTQDTALASNTSKTSSSRVNDFADIDMPSFGLGNQYDRNTAAGLLA